MKRKFVKLTDVALKQFVTQHTHPTYLRVKEGIPETAKLIKWGFLPSSDLDSEGFVFLVFEDESFPEIKEGTISEEMFIVVRTHIFADETSLENVDLRS